VAACSISDDSAVIIAKALAQNNTLKTLDLSCNAISDTGAEELGTALKRNSSLKGLLLWNNRVFHTGAEALASGLASNNTLQWLGVRRGEGGGGRGGRRGEGGGEREEVEGRREAMGCMALWKTGGRPRV
jgi:hypothetical protein